MKKIFFLTILSAFLLVFFVGKLSAQVTIGADVAPKPFSVLELMGQYETGVFGGLRLPQLTTEQRDALTDLSSPEAKGLTIFNTTTDVAEYWDGTAWVPMDGRSGGGGGGTVTPCGKCGAYVAPGLWKEFMCHNLGANYNADPFTPSAEINGGHFQWGAYFATEMYSTWNSTPPSTYYGDNTNSELIATKSPTDPCPPGYRVPSYAEWEGVINNNTRTNIPSIWTGAWTGAMFGDNLFLPAAGFRVNAAAGQLYNRGLNGYYWSSRIYDATRVYDARFTNIFPFTFTEVANRENGQSIRCIAE